MLIFPSNILKLRKNLFPIQPQQCRSFRGLDRCIYSSHFLSSYKDPAAKCHSDPLPPLLRSLLPDLGQLDALWTSRPVLSPLPDPGATGGEKYCPNPLCTHTHAHTVRSQTLLLELHVSFDYHTERWWIHRLKFSLSKSTVNMASLALNFCLCFLLFPVDFLAKYCIFSQEKLAEYKRAFEAVSEKGFKPFIFPFFF